MHTQRKPDDRRYLSSRMYDKLGCPQLKMKPAFYYLSSEAKDEEDAFQKGCIRSAMSGNFIIPVNSAVVLSQKSSNESSAARKWLGGVALLSGLILCGVSYLSSIFPAAWPLNLMGAKVGEALTAFGLSLLGIGSMTTVYDAVHSVPASPVKSDLVRSAETSLVRTVEGSFVSSAPSFSSLSRNPNQSSSAYVLSIEEKEQSSNGLSPESPRATHFVSPASSVSSNKNTLSVASSVGRKLNRVDPLTVPGAKGFNRRSTATK